MESPEDKVREYLRKRVDAIGKDASSDKRQVLYDDIRRRVRDGVEIGKFQPEASRRLEATIEQFERQFAAANTRSGEAETRLASPIGNAGAGAAGDDYSDPVTSLPPAMDMVDRAEAPPAASRAGPRGLAAALLAIMIVGGIFYYDPLGLFAGTSETQGAEVALDRLTIDPLGEKSALGQGLIADKGESIVVTGPASLYSKGSFSVDVNKRYEISARLRVLPADDGVTSPSVVFGGVATFDEDGNIQTSPPGTHRYVLFDGESLEPSNEWVEKKAIIAGAGDGRIDQFRVGTTSARLVLIVSYKGDPETRVEIANLSWRRLDD